jgi:hypothetical protein
MRRHILILLLAVSACFGAETRAFFGKWTPPASLTEFWRPINESWWNKGSTPKLDQRCREFARKTKPERIIPDMITDLKTSPSEVRWSVYLNVMRNWAQQRVLHILKPFYHSRDPEIASIAREFWADVEPSDRRE